MLKPAIAFYHFLYAFFSLWKFRFFYTSMYTSFPRCSFILLPRTLIWVCIVRTTSKDVIIIVIALIIELAQYLSPKISSWLSSESSVSSLMIAFCSETLERDPLACVCVVGGAEQRLPCVLELERVVAHLRFSPRPSLDNANTFPRFPALFDTDMGRQISITPTLILKDDEGINDKYSSCIYLWNMALTQCTRLFSLLFSYNGFG